MKTNGKAHRIYRVACFAADSVKKQRGRKMELKEYRLERLRSACAEAGADLNYITTGYVCVNQDVLTRAECAIGYIPAKDKYVYIVGYAELPTVFEFAGLDTEVHFYGGAFCFENGDKGNPFVEKIMAYQKEAHPTSADAWNAAVRANLPEGPTVAIDESRIFASVLKNVEEKLSGYHVINATDIFMRARQVKHPEEVAGVEASARCASDAMTAALANFKRGMTEYEIGELYNIELAKRGMGYTSPNPMVGAVIVKDGRIIGEGWHERYGELHAERNALKHCKELPQGADMYVTLEPCCHHGKQPPCVEAVIEAGIKKVYVGSDDPNPLVAGGGIKILKEHGIEVVTQVLKDECDRLNEVFFYFIQTRRPYVAMKYAMTMDGKIATYSGLSKWITGEKAREHVQNLRHRYKAIMAGIGTVLADDPLLTCRIEGGVNPIRIICDTHLKLPLESQIVNTAKEVPTIVAVSERYRETAQSEALPDTEKDSIEENNNYQKNRKITRLEENGIEILYVAEKNSHIDLNDLMQKLGERSIDSILLEGGGILNWSALKSGIVNKVYAYIAPKLFGGADAKTPIEGMGTDSPAHAVMLGNSKVTKLGDDFLIESDVVNT